MILLGGVFQYYYVSLDLSLKGCNAWLITLTVIGGCRRMSKYHATLCPRSVNYSLLLIFFPIDSTN